MWLNGLQIPLAGILLGYPLVYCLQEAPQAIGLRDQPFWLVSCA